MSAVLAIDLSPDRGTVCCVCEAECDLRQGLRTYEDLLVADDYEGPDAGGQAACRRCYDAWVSGAITAGMTFHEARKLVERGDDRARAALDRGDA